MKGVNGSTDTFFEVGMSILQFREANGIYES